MAVLDFWGKTSGGQPPYPWKPVLHHMLDVAAAAIALQKSNQQRLRREADVLGVAPEALAAARACLAGWHDLGKFARAFQAKAPAFFPAILGSQRPDETGLGFNHGEATARLLSGCFPAALGRMMPGLLPTERDAIALTIGGHHGRPLETDGGPYGDRDMQLLIGDAACEAAREAVDIVWRLTGVPIVTAPEDEDWTARFCWSLAGFVTLADWVGSDTGAFPFMDPNTPAEDYWPGAQRLASVAVAGKRLIPACVAPEEGAGKLFGIDVPWPMQAKAETVAIPDGPTLAIIEDATGAGKTESAVVLAQRMMVAGKGEGVYFALPTMATANAMFERLYDVHRRLFAKGSVPSLALLHGRRDLSETFAEVRLAGRGSADVDEVAAQCGEWIADDRRRAFFAEIGAGTIDQALLSVLPKKFFALRQQGLAGKVLIVDEAHAYDAYVMVELERLLRFHAAAGGSAIILSATLTAKQRENLAAAFLAGLSADRRPSTATDYPLLTIHGATSRSEAKVRAAKPTIRRVLVERLPDWEAALDLAAESARLGAAVALIRNAVDDVIVAHEQLESKGIAATLFHARFAFGDRLAIERDVVGTFGKRGRGREGRMVVASQVLQESLDCDFDVMVTDLAPIDLLIQRAGRLWRHERRGRPVKRPRLLVVAPDWASVSGADWLCGTQPKGASIYRAGVQWRSARALFQAGAIDAPGGLRALVEAAYAEDDDLPEPLRGVDERRFGKERAAGAHAGHLTLDWDLGYWRARAIGVDQEAGTRLGEETATLRLARLVEGAVAPWIDDADPARAWAMSEVTAQVRWLGEGWREAEPPANLRAAVTAAKAVWPEFEREMKLGVVAEGGRVLLDGMGLDYGAASGLNRA